MAKNQVTDLKEISTPSLISEGLKVVGEMHSKENIRIDGKYSGNITVDGFLRVGKSGKIDAEIHVNTIAVEGEIKGNIYAKEKVHLYPTGQVIGDVHCPRTGLSIDPGALFEGRSIMHDESKDITRKTETKKAKPEQKNNKSESKNK